MCEPTTIAYAVIAIGSAVMGHQQAEASADFQTKVHKQNQANSTQAAVNAYQGIQQRQRQEAAATAEQIEQRRLQERRDLSSAIAAGADSGLSGFSMDSILRDISGVASRDVTNMAQNRDWSAQQLTNEMTGIKSKAEGRMGSTTPGIGPNPWATAFKIGEGALGAYTMEKG